jgi:LPS sulfotransferase NodH
MRSFLIVAEIRSGYQLMATLLNSNPEVICLGEIFGSDRDIRAKSLFQFQVPVIEETDRAISYVEKIARSARQTGCRVFGFKLNYVCARNSNWSELWDYAVSKRWNIIHLRRDNLLDRLISEKLATSRNNWNHTEYQNQITVSLSELERSCARSMACQSWANWFFRRNPICNMTYEELEGNQEKSCEVLQDFLGVTRRPLKTFMKKQRVGNQSKFVANYTELYHDCSQHPVFSKWLDGITYL